MEETCGFLTAGERGGRRTTGDNDGWAPDGKLVRRRPLGDLGKTGGPLMAR